MSAADLTDGVISAEQGKPVSVGYVRTEDEGIEKTPDRKVQEAIAGIFRKFRELGSVRQVLLWYRDEKLLIPALSRESGHRKMVWIEPFYSSIFGILKNPTYAGVFVWGRNHTRTSIVDGRARKTRGTRLRATIPLSCAVQEPQLDRRQLAGDPGVSPWLWRYAGQ